MNIIGFAQLHNELEKGNLIPWLDSLSTQCDKVYIYEQGSTDGSLDIYKNYSNLEIIYSRNNDFSNEILYKQLLLEKLQKQEGYDNIIFWIDGDTFVDTTYNKNIILNLFEERQDCTHIKLRHYNLWRSDTYYRTDNRYHNFYNKGVCCFWRNSKDLKFITEPGLHKQQYPICKKVGINFCLIETALIHRGFATDFQILKKYTTYKSFGQVGDDLERLLDEKTLSVEQLPLYLIPNFIPKNPDSPISKKPIREIYNESYGNN